MWGVIFIQISFAKNITTEKCDPESDNILLLRNNTTRVIYSRIFI
jgi:hypothetical protein